MGTILMILCTNDADQFEVDLGLSYIINSCLLSTGSSVYPQSRHIIFETATLLLGASTTEAKAVTLVPLVP
jgi:hypothetical protein